MIDSNVIITIIPPIITGIFAYMIARKKNLISEKINKAKVDAAIQTQALTIVSGLMNDMRDELRREISDLRQENESLKDKLSQTEERITNLTSQCMASNELVETLKLEIASLRSTIRIYEEEIARLKKSNII